MIDGAESPNNGTAVDGAGPPNEGTAVASIQRQRWLDRVSIRRRRQTVINNRLARQHQRCDIVIETVRPGQMILFSNNCLHAGGSNKLNNILTRIFGYVCAAQTDIPVGKVFPFNWTSPNEDAVVVEDDGINNIVSESNRGRIRKKTNFFAP
jgi:hypothetical protein